MNDNYRLIYLTHANLKQRLHLVAGTISAWHFSDKSKCTHVYTTAGIFPAVETPEEIDKIILETAILKEDNNG